MSETDPSGEPRAREQIRARFAKLLGERMPGTMIVGQDAELLLLALEAVGWFLDDERALGAQPIHQPAFVRVDLLEQTLRAVLEIDPHADRVFLPDAIRTIGAELRRARRELQARCDELAAIYTACGAAGIGEGHADTVPKRIEQLGAEARRLRKEAVRCPVLGCGVFHVDGPRACVSTLDETRARAFGEIADGKSGKP